MNKTRYNLVYYATSRRIKKLETVACNVSRQTAFMLRASTLRNPNYKMGYLYVEPNT